jgi:hypothetical protein
MGDPTTKACRRVAREIVTYIYTSLSQCQIVCKSRETDTCSNRNAIGAITIRD